MTKDGEPDRSDPPPAPPDMKPGQSVQPDIIDSDGSNSRGSETVPVESITSGWTRYFRYESAYTDQVEAIDTFIELLGENGYYVHEGACGTGKSLMAVSAGIHAVRDRDELAERDTGSGEFPHYSRVVVATPLKQQLKQFVEEMRGINRSIARGVDPVSTVVMRGRSDMLPYAYTDVEPFDESHVTAKIDELREMTAELIRFDSNIPIDWPDGMTPEPFSRHDYNWDNASETAEQHRDQYRYDPHRARAVQRLVADLDRRSAGEQLVVDGVETPYPDYVPSTNDIVDTTAFDSGQSQLPVNLQGWFDPFYAAFFAGGAGHLPFGFDDADQSVFDREELISQAASRGICPHETMAHLAGDAEVVLGNYNHLFDPQTRLLTEEKAGILDEQSIVVLDEAHQIESRVRDMLSAELDIYTLDRAIGDVKLVYHYATGEFDETPSSDLSSNELANIQSDVKQALKTVPNYSVSVDELATVERFLRLIKQKLVTYGTDAVDEEFGDKTWQQAVEWGWDLDDIEYPLTDPEDPADAGTLIEEVVVESDFDAETFRMVYKVMLGLKLVYEMLDEEGVHDRTPQGVAVGDFFKRWVEVGGVEYFRHVVLERSQKDTFPTEYPEWVSEWTPKLQLFNCIPREELQAVFAELGGGVLMSATIQPEDVFTEAVGVDSVPYPSEDDKADTTSDADDEEADRPVEFEQYPLRFPEENRISVIGDLPKFTNSNRGNPTQREADMSKTRKQYADVISRLAGSPGNVLIAMPNYREAGWAHEYVKQSGVSKRLLLDQSSSSQKTDETLEEFFAEGESVIFTSSRGTITEGVDYDGGKLHCCVAVGIPLLPTYLPRIKAIRTAYDKRMNGSGFETALTVPAVRKVRQALGRVIRGADEVGARILLDERYASSGFYGVEEYLSEWEREEFNLMDPSDIDRVLSVFWEEREVEQSSVSSNTDDDPDTSHTVVEPTVEVRPSEGDDSDSDQVAGDVSVDEAEYSKIYFGEGAGLSGWVSIRTSVIEQQIVPLVRSHTVEEPNEVSGNTIKLNFSKELPVNGWTAVESDIVTSRIEPIAEEAMKPAS